REGLVGTGDVAEAAARHVVAAGNEPVEHCLLGVRRAGQDGRAVGAPGDPPPGILLELLRRKRLPILVEAPHPLGKLVQVFALTHGLPPRRAPWFLIPLAYGRLGLHATRRPSGRTPTTWKGACRRAPGRLSASLTVSPIYAEIKGRIP